MVSKTWNFMLVAVVANTMTITASAQTASAQTKPRSAPITSIVMPPGTDATTYRAMTISVQRLNNPALSFTSEQWSEISRVIDSFVTEQMALDRTSPLAKSASPSRSELQGRKSAFARLSAKLGEVMNSDQRKIWEADVIAHRPVMTRTPDGGVAISRD